MTECNVENRTIFCDDNLDVLCGINSQCIDLIYLDPPFNKNKKFTAPIGTSAEGAGFKDIFREEDLKQEWSDTLKQDQPELFSYLNGIKEVGNHYNFAYLAYMAIRLIECHRVLKSTGSLYLHCDPTMSHYLKTTMDCIFGEKNFRNEVVWCYSTSGRTKKFFAKKHDIILLYTKTNKSFWGNYKIPVSKKYLNSHYRQFDSKGRRCRIRVDHGKTRIYYPEDGMICNDWWEIPYLNSMSEERTGYPTQKPVVLLERIIKASSNEGDMVLDPFCGCATTCVAAERLDRNWIGIDTSIKAYELVKERLDKEVVESPKVWVWKDVIDLKTDPPNRTDQAEDYREQKFVYVISHPKYPGEYKVGIAKDWKSRLNSYQTSDPDRQYKLEFKLETPWFRETEQYIHGKFENKHEWVSGNMEDIIDEIRNYKPITEIKKIQDSLDFGGS